MNSRLIILIFFFLVPGIAKLQVPEQIDISRSLRIDFILSGTKKEQFAGLLRIKEEKYWSSPANAFISPFGYGSYRIDLLDADDSTLLFRRGFSTLFEEWQTTDLPKHGPASFEQSINLPYPENKVLVKLFYRSGNVFKKFVEWKIDPESDAIIRDNKGIEPILLMGDKQYRNKLDLAFLADGYKAEDNRKAKKDARRFARFLLSQEPFSAYRKYINIWLVHPHSTERGTDEPCRGIYKETPLGSSFNTLGLRRYLSTERYFDVKDAAADTPYDFFFVMVNTERYGGGGVFNHFSVFSADGEYGRKVFVHEFGHHFGGLADEYFNSDVTYVDMMDTAIEPWQPNVTTMVEFDSKWKNLIKSDVPIPTPRTLKYKDYLGVFEGGAYVSKGVYSPAMDCRMRTNKAKEFCPACKDALIKMLEFYIEKEQ